MATVSQVRVGLQNRLATIFRGAYDVEPSKLVVPAAIVSKVEAEYQVSMGPLAHYNVEIIILADLASNAERGQRALDGFLSPTGATSVATVIEADRSLGGIADLTTVQRFRDAGILDRSGTQFIGAILDVEVWAS